ncbi:MAG: DUF935 family protein, partial [Spirochaetaceae bacterium]|nr:DUF935 family protein [Spirochaetaceae bacterium]
MKKTKTGKKASKKARKLAQEQATASLTSVRQGWDHSSVASALNPKSLANLLQSARQGEARDYLTLAEEMEERDLYYRATLSTRKLAVQGIEPTVVPAGEDEASIDLAAAVRRDIVERPEFTPMVYDAMDAIAKGYAAIEILWQTGSVWRPNGYRWRDPRWFRYDRETGRQLRLLDDANPVDGVELEPNKWIIHEPQLKSGLPIRGGLALPVAYYHLVKTFDVASWAAFVEVFGYPLRVGKYSKNATEEDIKILKRAVANVGRDIGAVIPDDMILEIIAGVQQGAAVDYFKILAEFANREIAIGVLGQAATTEGTPGRLGADDVQQQVREDILRSDARQVGSTLQRDLVETYVDFNHGPQVVYPQLRFVVEDPEDVGLLVDAVSKLVAVGFQVKPSDLYQRLRLTEPKEGDAVLEPPSAPALGRALANVARPPRRGVEDELDELLDHRDWEPLTRPLYETVQEWAANMQSLEEAERRLPELLQLLQDQGRGEQLAARMLRGRGRGAPPLDQARAP